MLVEICRVSPTWLLPYPSKQSRGGFRRRLALLRFGCRRADFHFDLCNARIAACTKIGEQPVDLTDLFAEDVTRQELLEALERLHQPRDAFKLLYRCVMEHCASVTAAQNEWKIPRHILANVTKSETERVQQMYRGIRPA